MNEYCFFMETDCFNSCFWISTLLVPFLTFLIIRLLRPNLEMSILTKEIDCLKVSIVNKSWFFNANNIRIEICAYNNAAGFTYHFEPDHSEFLIIPRKSFFSQNDNIKNFICHRAANSALFQLGYEMNDKNDSYKKGFSELILLLESGYRIRVRCHAYNSFSGLGKSFEKIY